MWFTSHGTGRASAGPDRVSCGWQWDKSWISLLGTGLKPQPGTVYSVAEREEWDRLKTISNKILGRQENILRGNVDGFHGALLLFHS